MFNFRDGDLEYLIRLYEEEGELQKYYNYKRPISEMIYKNTKYKQRAEFYVDNTVYSIPINHGLIDINSFLSQYKFTLMELIGLSKSMFSKYFLIIIDNKDSKGERFKLYELKELNDIKKISKFLQKHYGKIDPLNINLYINGYSYNLNCLIENLDNVYRDYIKQKEEELKLKEEAKLERDNLL